MKKTTLSMRLAFVMFSLFFTCNFLNAQRSCEDDPTFVGFANFDGALKTIEFEAGTAPVVDQGDVFRFPNVTPGLDCLVRVVEFINGAGISNLDNLDASQAQIGGFDRAFQPVLEGTPGTNGQQVNFEFTFVRTGTNIVQEVSIYMTALDIDSDTAGDVERVELETPDAYITTGPGNTEVIISTPPGFIRGESNGSGIVNGIQLNEDYRFTAYYNSYSSIRYNIAKDGFFGGGGFEDR